jgi:hypothetical protein
MIRSLRIEYPGAVYHGALGSDLNVDFTSAVTERKYNSRASGLHF